MAWEVFSAKSEAKKVLSLSAPSVPAGRNPPLHSAATHRFLLQPLAASTVTGALHCALDGACSPHQLQPSSGFPKHPPARSGHVPEFLLPPCPCSHLLITELWLPLVTSPCARQPHSPTRVPMSPLIRHCTAQGVFGEGKCPPPHVPMPDLGVHPHQPSSFCTPSAQPQPCPSRAPCRGWQTALPWALPRSGQCWRPGRAGSFNTGTEISRRKEMGTEQKGQ